MNGSCKIVTVYGLPQSHVGAQDFNNSLLALAAQRIEQVNLPAIVLGDFHADVSKLPAASLLAKMGFLHLQQLYSQMYGEVTPPTRKEATNPDTAFLAPEIASRLSAISVVQEPLFDAHKVVLFSFHTPGKGWRKQVWPKPKPFTNFAIPTDVLEDAARDLSHVTSPHSLEDWGRQVERTVDVVRC